jgi:DNA-directed RNA polymerase alpha subunit
MYEYQISYLQKVIQNLDVNHCKVIANWLTNYIKTFEVEDELHKIHIRQLGLSARTYNVLHANNINTIGQLVKLSADWDNIRILKGAGDKVLNEIKQKLAQLQSGTLTN